MRRDVWVMIFVTTRSSALTAAMLAAVMLTSCTANQLDAPPTSTVTPSDISNTATAAITNLPAVSTATSTPEPSATTLDGAALYEERFTDNRNNWYTNPPLVSVDSGIYLHVLECPESSSAAYCGNFIQIPFAFPGSFRMEIETSITSASEGAGVMVGFQVRRSDEGYYYLNYGIRDGSYEMSRVTQTGAFPIVAKTQTDLISTSVGATNIAGIEINGAEFTPLLNGEMASLIHDGNIRTAGDTYLVVLVERGHRAEVQFDNLIVSAVD